MRANLLKPYSHGNSYRIRGTLLLFFLIVLTSFSAAQTRQISGSITDGSGEPLIGANILVKGTTRGVVSDFEGKFVLELNPEDKTLIVSYTGFSEQEITLDNRDIYNIVLEESIDLSEVVVTALGVEREEKALGYAVTKLDANEISTVKPVNLTNALAGKVPGVYISGSANGPTASSNITIRGETSLTGNSQPLFVVNGMPITNGLFSPGDGLNGSTTVDFGNSAQLVNPDDIESISVLKGPAAGALYGSRASNGVILISTKTGEKSRGWGVEINSTTNFETILKLPDFQNSYGFGGYGFYSYLDGTNYTSFNGINYYDAFGENWGPRLDGTPIIQWNSNGVPVPNTPAENNVRNFFRTGITAINNIAITNNSGTGNFRLSYSNLSRRGIVPNTNLSRNTLSASFGKRLWDERLRIQLDAMYVGSGSDNVPNAGYDENSSVMYGWLWYPRQVPIDDLRQYWKPGLEGVQQRYVEELWVNNPWFVANENTNSFNEDRIFGTASVEYDFFKNFSARFRFGADVKNEGRQFRRAPSTQGIPFGSYREDELSFTETNTELLLSYTLDPEQSPRFGLGLKLGGNLMRQQSKILSANNPQLLQPSLYTLSNNRSGILVDNRRAEKGINSVFAVANLSFDNFIYLDLTGRNDWSSTLPTENNSYFYPSATLSVILSEKLGWSSNSVLSFLKLRGAYAEVGADTDPYLLQNFYEPEPLFGGTPALSTSSFAANPDLRPERTVSWEIGADIRFLNNRLRLDATYYDMLSKDQIIFLPVATTSGKSTRLVNAGEIRNRGVEILLSAEPIRTSNFSWRIDWNLGHNRAIVETLPDGVAGSYPLVADVFPGDEGSANLELVAIRGELLGQLFGLGFQRDEQGRIIHENGLPLLTEEKVSAGSYQPKLRTGIYNTFTLGAFSLGFLFDGQVGGKIYSRTHALMNTGGTITNNNDPNLALSTLDGRAEYDISYNANGDPVYDLVDAGGVVGPGVMFDGDGNLVPNTVSVPTRDYFYAYYGNGFNRDNIEAATYDATYFKLRELRLTYQLPAALVQRWGIQGASVSLLGRNLLLFSDVPSIDPETYSIRNGRFVNGFESTQLPSVRSMGFSLNLSF
jgi:TonB-linked SusC/RagA family outer membrane protein